MISVAIVDDHHAVRLGLTTALRAEPGLVPVGAAGSGAEAAPLLYRTRPDVVILDYHLPDGDGLSLCRELKSDVPAPAVIVYSAFADASMTVPAVVAGADGIVHKGAEWNDLCNTVREVARGRSAIAPIPRSLLRAAADAVQSEDVPILSMLVDGTPPPEVAETLRLAPAELRLRIARMLDRLRVPVPDHAG